MIERRFDLQAFVRSERDYDDEIDADGNAHTIFMQSTMFLERTPAGGRLDVNIKSLAPQHDSLGTSVAPTVLRTW